MKWDDAKDAELIRRFNAGEDFGLIASVLQCRVPNVIGRLRDLKLLDRSASNLRKSELREKNLIIGRSSWRRE